MYRFQVPLTDLSFTQPGVVMNPKYCQSPLAKCQTMNCVDNFYHFESFTCFIRNEYAFDISTVMCMV